MASENTCDWGKVSEIKTHTKPQLRRAAVVSQEGCCQISCAPHAAILPESSGSLPVGVLVFEPRMKSIRSHQIGGNISWTPGRRVKNKVEAPRPPPEAELRGPEGLIEAQRHHNLRCDAFVFVPPPQQQYPKQRGSISVYVKQCQSRWAPRHSKQN